MGDNNPQVVEAKRPASVDEIRLELARLAACPQRREMWLRDARRRLYGSRVDPAEAVQEALTRCLAVPEGYNAAKGEVAVWVYLTLKTVCKSMRGKEFLSLAQSDDLDGLTTEEEALPSHRFEQRQRNRYAKKLLRKCLSVRMKAILRGERRGRSMSDTANRLGVKVESLYAYKSGELARLKSDQSIQKHRKHLWSPLPLLLWPGADGANARRSLWVWVARGKQALVTALATAAVVVPVTAQLTTRAVRNAMPRAAVVAPVAPVPAPVAPIAASPLYARPAEMPVVEESDVMLAVARTPVEPSQPATASGPREVTPAALRAQRARQHIDDAVSSLEAGHPRLALQHIEDAARLAPQVEPEHRESRRCLALHGLGRRSDAEACARRHLARWSSSIFAAQMGQVLSPR